MSASLHSVLVLLFFADMALMLTVGGRLLLAAHRTRRAPEAAIGTSATCGAAAVISGLVVTQVLGQEPSAFPVWALARVLGAVGVAALAIGSWRIYRPDQTLAAAAAAAICAVAAAGCAARILPGTITAPGDASFGRMMANAASLLSYGWATFEAFRYHGQLRRRLALGLADPMVTRQFKLWAVSGLCALGTTAASAFFVYVLNRPLSTHFFAFVAVQLALFVASLCLWLAFYPPRFYRRRVSPTARA